MARRRAEGLERIAERTYLDRATSTIVWNSHEQKIDPLDVAIFLLLWDHSGQCFDISGITQAIWGKTPISPDAVRWRLRRLCRVPPLGTLVSHERGRWFIPGWATTRRE